MIPHVTVRHHERPCAGSRARLEARPWRREPHPAAVSPGRRLSGRSVQFRTTPTDSTGVPHVLEHTVLCGSRRYPCRDPFFKMLDRSLSTFMNAFTGRRAAGRPRGAVGRLRDGVSAGSHTGHRGVGTGAVGEGTAGGL